MREMHSLCESEPDCSRHMFVFPTSLMTMGGALPEDELRIVREGTVALVCRDAAQARS